MSIRTSLAACLCFLSLLPSAGKAAGLLVPSDPGSPPLAIVYQRTTVEIRDQTATTKVEQEFRNTTSRPLEAYYMFPVPKGAAVRDFVLWVDGKPMKAELVEAGQARKIYEDVVRRLKDPGLLEHLGDNLFRVRVFPVPAHGLQKIELSYAEIAVKDGGVYQYTYPLKIGGEELRTEQDFTLRVDLHSAAALKNVYSPTHSVDATRKSDHHAVVGFEAKQHPLNKDFRLFWTTSDQDVGLAVLTHRESPGDAGVFLAMISPKFALDASTRAPRDVVFVLDVSGSMAGEKMNQARRALEYCLNSLDPADKFALISFATTTNAFESKLSPADKETVQRGVEWVKKLNASGGTAIRDALAAAFAMRADSARQLTIVFFTDGLPTIGETSPEAIVEEFGKRDNANTRVFCFGVGDEVNTHLLDQLADRTRATSVYVRPNEDLEIKASSFYDKIRHPVLTDLKLSVVGSGVHLADVFPPVLPDLFHGGQIVAAGRYSGDGPATLVLKGNLAGKPTEFKVETMFPKEKREGEFLPLLWARRKIGYLLDQIRLKGENKELVDEVKTLAKKYGVVTPYTSYLAVPDQAPHARVDGRVPQFGLPFRPTQEGLGGGQTQKMARGSVGLGGGGIGLSAGGGGFGGGGAAAPEASAVDGIFGGRAKSVDRPQKGGAIRRRLQTDSSNSSSDLQREAGDVLRKESGRDAVDVAQALKELKTSGEAEAQEARTISGRHFLRIGSVWFDDSYRDGAEIVRLRYLGKAYFRLLELVPQAKSVLSLGKEIVWVTPSGNALVISNDGKDEASDEQLRGLFTAKRTSN